VEIVFPALVNPNLAQQTWEFLMLQQFIKGKKLLEIGSRHGESLLRFALTMGEGSTVVSLDNNVEEGLGHLYFNALFLRRHTVELINGDSHDPGIVEKIKSYGHFDFVFVDGDHSEEGVTKDYENYFPLCNVMAFHDILLDTVERFWSKHKRDHPMMEIVHPSCHGAMGIGVLFNDNYLHTWGNQ